MRNYSYPEKSNLLGYRVNRVVSFQVFGDEYLGPMFVKDIYFSRKDEIHKSYIVSFTCSASRAVVLNLVEDNTSKNFINSIKKFIAIQDCSKSLVSDDGKAFMSQENRYFCAEQGITSSV